MYVFLRFIYILLFIAAADDISASFDQFFFKMRKGYVK